MEQYPASSFDSGQVLEHINERLRSDPIFHDSKGYSDLNEAIRSKISAWRFGPGELYRQRAGNGQPTDVVDTHEILCLDPQELEKYGASISMLRGHLSRYKKDYKDAIYHFEMAQSGYLAEGNIDEYVEASSLLALTARAAKNIPLAVKAHRNAIETTIDQQKLRNEQIAKEGENASDYSPFNYNCLTEYRRLARTLGTSSGIKKFGLEGLKALRKEVLQLHPISRAQAVDSILVLMQIEKELSRNTTFTSGYHYKKAKHIGFICDSADLGGGLGLRMMIHQSPVVRDMSVKDWYRTLKGNAPDMLVGGRDYFGQSDSYY